jgi:hypothetical protein
MSVASGSSSTLARYVASRILLKNKASVPGLKVQAVEAASNDAFGELNARGLFDPELRMAVQADVNLAVAPIRKYGGDVDVEFRVTLDAVLYQWY